MPDAIHILWTIIAGAFGGIMVACLTHIFAKDRDHHRDRRARKIAIEAFLEGWKQEIRGYPSEPHLFDDAYIAKLPGFRSACASAGVSDSKPEAARVGGFSMETYSIGQHEVKQRRNDILDAIDSLIRSL